MTRNKTRRHMNRSMTRNRLISSAAALAVPGVLLVSAFVSPAQRHLPPSGPARLAAVVDTWRARADVPGVVVSVRLAGGTEWVRADAAPAVLSGGLGPSSQFRIASITKAFVAVVVLQLAEEGLLGLDDQAERYLQGLPVVRGVTIRQLLNHTSGVPDYSAVDPEFGAQVLRDRGRRWTAGELVELAAQARPAFAPGTDYAYSNTNYVLLGMVIETITGTPWPVQVRTRILDPLRLDGTYIAGTEAPASTGLSTSEGSTGGGSRPGDGVVPGFHDADRDGREEDVEASGVSWTSLPTSEDAAGAVVSTASDVSAFGSALAQGRLLSADSLTAMLAAPPLHPVGSRYGLGLETKVLGGGLIVWGHGGFVPGFRSTLWHEPDGGLTVAVLADSSSANTEDLAELVLRTSGVTASGRGGGPRSGGRAD